MQLILVVGYRRMASTRRAELASIPPLEDWPAVTIQLPVYNEKYVIVRLIDAVAQIRYPGVQPEIQVLDDSDDESVQLAMARIEHWKSKGVNIHHIRRPDRVGYKAGALQYGLERAKGELIAIFDADFLPEPDFLEKTVAHFANLEIGMVQTRWGHLNEEYSLLTRLQAFGLDAHFTVEQTGRNVGGHFMNFNGTAGVWRAACIRDAGGWEHDTITEDLDLSYRAQLKGWKFLFLEDVATPAELPAEINALKNQQFRWTKGAAECAVKNLPKVFRDDCLPRSTKVHAFFHLLNSGVFLVVLLSALLSVPVLLIRVYSGSYNALFNAASVFLLSLLILVFFYWTASRRMGKSSLKFFAQFPLFLSVSMGMALHNSIAVIEGYLGKKSAFIRTPKFAIEKRSGSWGGKVYRAAGVSPIAMFEAILGAYFTWGVVLGVVHSEWALIPFHAMLAFGYWFVSFQSYRHILVK